MSNPMEAMQAAYDDTHYVFTRTYWVYTYVAAVDIIAKCLGAYYFGVLKLRYRALVLANYSMTTAYVVYFDGNQKAIGDMLIYLGVVGGVRWARGRVTFQPASSRKRGPALVRGLVVLLAGVTAFYLFLKNLSLRLSTWGWAPAHLGSGLAEANYDHWLIQALPESLRLGGMASFLYFSNGYLGLALSLKLPFEWSVGLGSSFTVRDTVTRLFGIGAAAYSEPYPQRLASAFGYDGYANWVTIFPWLASDFTFIGAVILLCGVVYLFAIAWFRAVVFGNWISIVLVAHLGILFVYVPNNNQLFQTRTSFAATWVLLLLWVIFRSRSSSRGLVRSPIRVERAVSSSDKMSDLGA